jgi:hypothetical protein
MQNIPRRSLINYIGVAILILGMATAELIYWRSLQNPAPPDDSELVYDSKVYEQTMEKNVGIFGVIMDQWSRSAGKLREPRALAITIGVVSIIAAAGCFLGASRMRE